MRTPAIAVPVTPGPGASDRRLQARKTDDPAARDPGFDRAVLEQRDASVPSGPVPTDERRQAESDAEHMPPDPRPTGPAAGFAIAYVFAHGPERPAGEVIEHGLASGDDGTQPDASRRFGWSSARRIAQRDQRSTGRDGPWTEPAAREFHRLTLRDASDDPGAPARQSLASDTASSVVPAGMETSAPRQSMTSPARQIVDHLAKPLADIAAPAQMGQGLPSQQHFRFTLHPDHLGEVQVVLRLHTGKLSVSIQAERGETADLLRRDLDLLNLALNTSIAERAASSVAVTVAAVTPASPFEAASMLNQPGLAEGPSQGRAGGDMGGSADDQGGEHGKAPQHGDSATHGESEIHLAGGNALLVL